MPIRLDERLTAIAEQAAGVRTVCDVGSDHGKLACWLVQTGRAERAVATDISAPSLKKAERLAEELGLADLVETRTGDGLDPVADREADAVVIAGMGGDLGDGILERAHAPRALAAALCRLARLDGPLCGGLPHLAAAAVNEGMRAACAELAGVAEALGGWGGRPRRAGEGGGESLRTSDTG